MHPENIADRLICVIPTSPVKSHPDTGLIDRTIASVRQQIGPNPLIMILADGVRAEQREMLKPYHTYVAELRRRYAGNMKYFVMEFFEHRHQVGMLRWVFRKGVGTLSRDEPSAPHILFIEHDTPLTPDPIDWEEICGLLDKRELDMVRFLYEGDIHPEHRHMLTGEVLFTPKRSYPLTRQFSARPHVATWDFYRRALEQFSPQANSFIEDKMHSVCEADTEHWRIGIYYPDPPRGRSFHLDGRQGDSKFEDRLVF